MKYLSTRESSSAVTISQAIAAGLAPDGGLYVPNYLPKRDMRDFQAHGNLVDTAITLLTPFFHGDALASELPALCAEALNFPIPLRTLSHDANISVLELFHGPTSAFKDVGARFLAACLRRLHPRHSQKLTILVATSGDTGAAVAAAFHRQADIEIVILYPDGRVSPRQAHQLGCFGDNVHTLRVQGCFDDCQRMVKAALSDTELQAQIPLSSANSISLGRLLPQMCYYAHAALMWWRTHQKLLHFIVPTGNLGNALAAVWVRSMGLPIGQIILTCNANATLPEFFAGCDYVPRPAIATLANAMDVGAPSNFERLRWTFPDAKELRTQLQAYSVDDPTISKTIAHYWREYGEIFCPHTATAISALTQLREHDDCKSWAIVATAHPAKFESVVEPLIDMHVTVPPALVNLLQRSSNAQPLVADEQALRGWLLKQNT